MKNQNYTTKPIKHTSEEFPNCSPEMAQDYADQLNDLVRLQKMCDDKIKILEDKDPQKEEVFKYIEAENHGYGDITVYFSVDKLGDPYQAEFNVWDQTYSNVRSEFRSAGEPFSQTDIEEEVECVIFDDFKEIGKDYFTDILLPKLQAGTLVLKEAV